MKLYSGGWGRAVLILNGCRVHHAKTASLPGKIRGTHWIQACVDPGSVWRVWRGGTFLRLGESFFLMNLHLECTLQMSRIDAWAYHFVYEEIGSISQQVDTNLLAICTLKKCKVQNSLWLMLRYDQGCDFLKVLIMCEEENHKYFCCKLHQEKTAFIL